MRLKSLVFVLGLLGAGAGGGSWSETVPSALSTTCSGDCSGDGVVTVGEILTMVDIALGNTDVAMCTPGDAAQDSRITVDEILAAVNNALQGCPLTATPTKTPGPPKPTPTPSPTMSSELELFDVGANFFSIRKPKGWEVYIGKGVCTTLGILMRDPAVPLRQIFYFGTIGPVYLTEQQRQIDQYYIDHGGYDLTWLDAPVVDPLTTENFFVHWPGIANMKAATDFMPEFPKLTGLTVISNTPQSSIIPGGDSALLRGLFMESSQVGEGQFLGTVWVSWPFTGMPGGGTGYGGMILGVTAPKGEFSDVEARLIDSLETFTVTQGYVDWCIKQQGQLWGAVAQEGQVLSETSDMIFEGWQNRSQASDIIAEKGSDAMLGLERVYDPSTNQVYEVPAGWYTTYDTHRSGYAMNDLRLLPDGNYQLWMSAPADGSEIH